MSDKNYYKDVAGGAAVATGVSILMEVGVRLVAYWMDPVSCPEFKQWLTERSEMVAKGYWH